MTRLFQSAMFLLWLACLQSAPQAPRATPQSAESQHSYVFASPNTRTSLTDQDARNSLDSFEQKNAISVADRIACSMTHTVRISDTVGIMDGTLGVSDGAAENSFAIETDLKKAQAEYLASLLGRYAHQEYVLLFLPQAGGKTRLWIIKTLLPFETIAKKLRQLHFTSLAVMPGKDRNEIWVVDFKGELKEKPEVAAKELQGTIEMKEGTAELIGDDDISKAASIFQKKIDTFEKNAKLRLSAHLWSQKWRDATTLTCSATTHQ